MSGRSATAAALPWKVAASRPDRRRRPLRRLAAGLGLALALLGATPDARPAVAAEWGAISGRVVFPAGVDTSQMTDVQIIVHDPLLGWSNFINHPDPDGSFTIPAYPGVYEVLVRPPAGLGLAPEYYGGTYALGAAWPVTVADGSTTTGVDVELDTGGSISGRVTGPTPADRWYVTALTTASDTGQREASPAADGSFLITGLPPGDYTLSFSGPSFRYWPDAARAEDAGVFPVALGRTSTVSASLKRAAYLEATPSRTVTTVGESFEVLVSAMPAPGYAEVQGTVEFVTAGRVVASGVLDAAGNTRATISGLPAGRHVITARLVEDALYYGTSARDVVVHVGAPQPPVVTRVLPGASAAGASITELTILGAGFTRDATVRIGGVDYLYPTVISPTQMALYGRSVPAGTHAVTVTTPLGTSPATPAATVTGWTVQPPAGLVSMDPVRVLDARGVAPGRVGCIQVAGTHGIPSDATGLAVTVTAAAPTDVGHVVVFPDTAGDGSTPAPETSTVNYEPGQDVANGTFLGLPPSGRLCYLSRGAPSTRLVIDVSGYTRASSGFVLTTPERLLDTRTTGEAAAPRTVTEVQVAGLAGVPVGAHSVIVNVAATQVRTVGNLRLFEADQPVPGVSSLNYTPGRDKANTTVVRLSRDGRLSYYSDTAGPVHVVLDVVGFVMAEPDYSPASARLLDTRVESPTGLAPGRVRSVDLRSPDRTGSAVPANATAALLNVAVVGPPTVGHLRVYPSRPGAAPPDVSSLNYIPGRDIANLVVVDLTAGQGVVDLYSVNSSTHVVVDLVGYLTR